MNIFQIEPYIMCTIFPIDIDHTTRWFQKNLLITSILQKIMKSGKYIVQFQSLCYCFLISIKIIKNSHFYYNSSDKISEIHHFNYLLIKLRKLNIKRCCLIKFVETRSYFKILCIKSLDEPQNAHSFCVVCLRVQ